MDTAIEMSIQDLQWMKNVLRPDVFYVIVKKRKDKLVYKEIETDIKTNMKLTICGVGQHVVL